MPELSDREIVEKAVDGDTLAFRHLVERHQSFVYRLAYRFVGSVGDAEDITQETFIRLWKNLKHYNSENKLTTWLYKIATNLCLDFLKSRQNKNGRRSETISNNVKALSYFQADQGVLNDELAMAVKSISEYLSHKQKAVFVLRDIEDLSMEEIGKVLSMSAGKVKSNLYYARKRVAELLEHYYQTKPVNNDLP